MSGGAHDEDGLLQVIEMDSSISYAKDIDVVSGYIDVRGAWHHINSDCGLLLISSEVLTQTIVSRFIS